MSFTKRVLLGLSAGVFAGLLLGERAAPLQIIATGFVKLLQMTVLPYVVLSIISSLGSLSLSEARRLGLRVGTVILVLWGLSITFALLIPLSFPESENASFFSTAMLEKRPDFNFVDLYIPANPFHSLANSIVPAIVLFSIFVGIALISVPHKQPLLEVMRVAMEAVSRTTRFIVRLTPYGIFAIAAHAAGTLSMEQLERIEIYLISYIFVASLLALWVLPGLVSAVTPIPVKDLFTSNRDALITAFVAGDLFIVLPSLMEACELTLAKHRLGQPEEQRLPEVIVPASFNFPHAGKLLSLSFILFAGWFSEADLTLFDYPQLIGAGLLTVFGSLNAAIPFLLDLFRVPADTFQLYLATGVLNARFGTLVAAMHVIAVAILGSAAVAGRISLQPARLIRYGLTTLLLTTCTLGGLRALFATVLHPRFEGAEVVARLQPLNPHPDSVTLTGDQAAASQSAGAGVYEQIQARRTLRVGYFPNRFPFAFQNREGKLIGAEIEAAHMLAGDIGVEPRFILLSVRDLRSAMESGICDIIMSGVVVTPSRQGEMLFSRTYLDETLAFAVLDHRRHEFTTWDDIRRAAELRIGVPDLPHYVALLRNRLPSARLITFELDDFKLDQDGEVDAFAVPAEIAAAQTLLNPKFTVVVPAPDPIKMPVAYPLARRDHRWAEIVNTWIELRQKDGTFDALYKHWILGQSAKPRTPRWSILRNVLHWDQ
jgi:Na+/H+-dicarboxylate symporter/ABC-type amino acid transport substrate-binding protein